jgi:hypothetical protein
MRASYSKLNRTLISDEKPTKVVQCLWQNFSAWQIMLGVTICTGDSDGQTTVFTLGARDVPVFESSRSAAGGASACFGHEVAQGWATG